MFTSIIKLFLVLFLPQLTLAVPRKVCSSSSKSKNCVQKSPHAFYRTCQSYFDCQYKPDDCDTSAFFKCDGNKCVCELFGFSREEFGIMTVNWNKASKTCHIGLNGPCGVKDGIRVHCEPGHECVKNKCQMIEKETSSGCDESMGCEMGKEEPPCHDPKGCEFGRLTLGGADYYESAEPGSASQAHDRERERQYEQQPCEVTNSCENQSANQEPDTQVQSRPSSRNNNNNGNRNGNQNRKQNQDQEDAAWDPPPFKFYRYGKTDMEPPGSDSGSGKGNCEEEGPGCGSNKPSSRPPLGPRQGPPKPKACEDEDGCGEEAKPSSRPSRPSRPRPSQPKNNGCEEEDGCGKPSSRPPLGKRQGPPKPKPCEEEDGCGEEAKPSSRPPIGRRANRPPRPKECDDEDGSCGDAKPSTRPPLGPRQGPPKPKPCDDEDGCGDNAPPPPPPPPKRSNCNGGSCGRRTTKKPKFSCGDEGCGDREERSTRPPRSSSCGNGGCGRKTTTTTTTTTTTEVPCKKGSRKSGCGSEDEEQSAECDKFWPKMFAMQCPQKLRGSKRK